MSTDHLRYFEIPIGACEDTETSSLLKIILFNDDRKLRSHAVKHFTNLIEFESAWKSIISVDSDLIMQSITSLQNIGCLYYISGSDKPHCNVCRIFSKCTEFVVDLEKEYVRSAVKTIKECGRIPRYVFFLSSTDDNRMFFAIPDRLVIVKATIFKDYIFNLMTFYSGTSTSFVEMRDREVQKISKEACKNTILWCNYSSWGLNGISPVSGSERKKSKKVKKKKKKLHPYKRAGTKNWKQYLDE